MKESWSCCTWCPTLCQRKDFLIHGDGCIVCANIKNETKKKKKERPQRSTCYGHRKHKSFVDELLRLTKHITEMNLVSIDIKQSMPE